MYKTPCRCGKTSMLFKSNIGPFYIDKCCEIAGFDIHGNKAVQAVKEEIKKVEESAEKVLSRKERKALEAKQLEDLAQASIDAEKLPKEEKTEE